MIAACGNGNSIGGATAAKVGETRVRESTVLGAVDRALAGKTQVPRQQLIEEHLSTQLKLALYRAEARKVSLTITEEDKKATRASFEEQTQANGGLEKAAQDSGIAAADLPDVIEMFTLERMLGQQLIKDKPVTDAELEKLRTANPTAFADQAHGAHILVKDEALAKKLLAELKAGGDFAALAAKNSLDPGSKDKGGDLGTQPKGSFVPEFDAALFAAKPGEVVGPVKTQFGFHLIKLVEIKRFEDVKEQLRVTAGPAVARDRLKDVVRKGLEVSVNPRYGKWDPEKLSVVGVDSDGKSAEDPSAPSGAPDRRSADPVQPTGPAQPSK